jgi:hypothetical protein
MFVNSDIRGSDFIFPIITKFSFGVSRSSIVIVISSIVGIFCFLSSVTISKVPLPLKLIMGLPSIPDFTCPFDIFIILPRLMPNFSGMFTNSSQSLILIFDSLS